MASVTAPEDLASTWFLDHDSSAVQAFTDRAVGNARTQQEIVSRIFEAVRDGVRYDPYAFSLERSGYRASLIADMPGAFCVPKALLMVAACRAAGIPARIGFADVRNHLSTDQLLELMGTDLFRYHGYAAVHVNGMWVKASPAFNRELCARFGVPPLEFDGTGDALLHAFTGDGRRHMEYVADHGTFADMPFDKITDEYRKTYPRLLDRFAPADDVTFAGRRCA